MTNGVIVHNVSWYLGVQGMVLPEVGIGVETVEANSPAEKAGLQPGMVITSINGYAIDSEETMSAVIASSNGVLEMEVLVDDSGVPATTTVLLSKVIITTN